MRPTIQFFAILATLTLMLSISPGLGMGQGAGASGGADSPDSNQYIYLPQILNPLNQISGHVTDDGIAAPGVELGLWFYNGASWSEVVTTTTTLSGEYEFEGIPALSPGQKYLVSYINASDPTRLSIWNTRELTSFASTSIVNIGDFDIANLPLTSPVAGSEAVPPSNFQWAPRPATPSDSYIFALLDFYDGNPYFESPPQGYVNNYTLSSLPPGFQYCNPYFWGVLVNSPDGGQGASFWAYLVTLHQTALSGIHGCVTVGGVPTSGISLELLKWTGSFYTSAGTTTTNANGYFAFTGQTTLKTGEEYYVRYMNAVDVNRLAWHSTDYLTSYTSGSSVHIGDFDLANIALVSPDSGSTVPPSATFWWTPRPNTLWDDYEFDLYDPTDGDPYFYTYPTLGYADHYTLGGMPPGFSYGDEYWWEIWVSDLFYGWGVSYWAYQVYFTPTGMGVTSLEGTGIITRPDRERLLMERARRGTPGESQARLRFGRALSGSR